MCFLFKAGTMQKARGHAGGAFLPSPSQTPCAWGLASLHRYLHAGNLRPLRPWLLYQGFVHVKLGSRCWAEANGATPTGETDFERGLLVAGSAPWVGKRMFLGTARRRIIRPQRPLTLLPGCGKLCLLIWRDLITPLSLQI